MLRGDTRLEFDTQMNLHAVTLALALFVTSVEALEVQGDDHEAFGSSLVGRTNAEARTLIEQKYPRYSIRSGSFMSTWTRKEEVGLERYQLDCDTYLHLCFANIKDKLGNIHDSDKVTAFSIVRIEGLKAEVPPSTFDSIRLIHHSPSPEPQSFDPVALITVVNHLRSLEAAEATRRLKIYHDLAATTDPYFRWRYDLDEQRLFLIIRLLFVRRDGDARMPQMYIGSTAPSVPGDGTDWPLFPLAVRGDIPFFIADGYMLGGQPESPLRHLEYSGLYCTIRDKPLTPTQSPIEAIEELYGTKEWQALFVNWSSQPETYPADCRHKYLLRCQAMRCFPVEMALPVDLPSRFNPFGSGAAAAERAWTEYKKELPLLRVKWEVTTQTFVQDTKS
jgi:hypothetical protein